MVFEEEEEILDNKTINLENAIPFMVSRDGEIVCIPKTKDAELIGILGSRGTGKSFTLWGLISRCYSYLEKDSVFVSNDYTSESLSCFEKQKDNDFKAQLKFIGEQAYKIPYVPIYPNNKDLVVDENVPYYLKYGVPFKNFVLNIEQFNLIKGTLKYFKNIAGSILSIKHPDEESVSEIISNSNMPKESKMMLINIFGFYFKEKLFDLEQGTIGLVDFKLGLPCCGPKMYGTYDLISGLSYARYVPVLMTYSLMGKKYLYNYYANILKSIFENQEKGYAKKKNIVMHIFTDEISRLTQRDKETECTEILNEVAVRGRPLRIGFVYTTQHPSLLPREIKTNTKYAICLRNDKKEIEKVSETFRFTKKDIENIVNLKKREVLAVTRDEYFLFINPKEGTIQKGDGIVIGKLLPPLCNTTPPISEGEIN